MTISTKDRIVLFDLSGVFFNEGLSEAVKKINKRFGIDESRVEKVLNGDFAKEYRTGLIEPQQLIKSNISLKT
ncbi:hypothetical protein HYY72_00660 [Candidatus Woesearchaeota archaeon]|nr:hypothetical protein [Candidatus Woesearchaeota archaeon]